LLCCCPFWLFVSVLSHDKKGNSVKRTLTERVEVQRYYRSVDWWSAGWQQAKQNETKQNFFLFIASPVNRTPINPLARAEKGGVLEGRQTK